MIGIISDIHGNYPALKAVLDELDAIGCREIISLGDVCGYYCMVRQCIKELRERNIPNILGNHDAYVLQGISCGRSFTANLCLDYQRSVLSAEDLDWLKASRSDIKRNHMWFVHGGWKDYLDEYLENFDFLDRPNNDIKLYGSGHTHVQKKTEGKHAVYFNPGSVGQPRDYDSRAAYAIIENDYSVLLKRVRYDIDKIAFEMKKAGFQERVFSCLYHGMKIGEDGK